MVIRARDRVVTCCWCRQPSVGAECDDCRHRRDELDATKASGETLAVVAAVMLLAVILAAVLA